MIPLYKMQEIQQNYPSLDENDQKAREPKKKRKKVETCSENKRGGLAGNWLGNSTHSYKCSDGSQDTKLGLLSHEMVSK